MGNNRLACDVDRASSLISDIFLAYRWGFNHPATFNRNFRAAFGIKHSEARSQHGEIGRPL